jgi:hypothetical protein
MTTTAPEDLLLGSGVPPWLRHPPKLTLERFQVSMDEESYAPELFDAVARGLSLSDVDAHRQMHAHAWVNEATHAQHMLHLMGELAYGFGAMSLRAAIGWSFIEALEGDLTAGFRTGGSAPGLVRWMTGASARARMIAVRDDWVAMAYEGAPETLMRWAGGGSDRPKPQALALANVGWLFAAAGVTRAEAEAWAADGSLNWDAVRTLAALRGVPVPVTG